MLSADRCATSAVNKKYVWNGAQKKLCRSKDECTNQVVKEGRFPEAWSKEKTEQQQKMCASFVYKKGVCWE